MSEKDPIDPTAIRQLLKRWDSTAGLGQHRLAQLDCVDEKLAQLGHAETEVGRGMALKELLHEAIQTLRPNDGVPEMQDKAWYAFIIITERYCFGRLPEWIMVHLSISSRSFYRELRRGTDEIVLFLKHAESEARRQPIQTKVGPAYSAQSCLPPNLPAHPIVGRELFIDSIVETLIGSHSRFIALHGLPGVGKTTVASALIDRKEIADHFPDGVCWLNIGPEADLTAILANLAAFLGVEASQIRKSSSIDLHELIRSELAEAKRLFIFDDVWQAEDVQKLCLGGRHVAYLITTRQPAAGVAFAGPNVFTVPELESAQAEMLLTNLAPNIFDDEPAAVEMLQKTTGGLPLALIVFARYLQSQGYHGQKRRFQAAVEQLQKRQTRLKLADATVQTDIASLIGLSIENLPADVQQLFRNLTIFQPKPNSFSQDMALAVTGRSPEQFYRLVDSGLVESLGQDRYTLHQLVCDVGRIDFDQNLLVESYLTSISTFVNAQGSNFNRLQLDQINIEQAIRLGLAANEIEPVGRILFGYIDFLIDRGQSEKASEWIEAAFAQLPEGGRAKADLLYCKGRLADHQNESERAIAAFEQLLDLRDQIDLPTVMLRGQTALMRLQLRLGKIADASIIAEELEAGISQMSDLVWQGQTHQSLCGFFYFQSRYLQAFEQIDQARRCFEAAGFTAGKGTVYQNLGVLSLELGRLDTAATHYERALAHYRTAGNRIREGQILNNMGVLAVRKGQWRKGWQLHQQAFELRQEIGDLDGQGQSLNNLSIVAIAQKDVTQAEKIIGQGMELAQSMGTRFREASLTINQATLASIQRDDRRALTFAQAAYRLAEEINRESTLEESATEQGRLHLFLNELDEAEKWLKVGRKLCRDQQLVHQSAMNSIYLAKLSQAQNEFAQTRSYLGEAVGILDKSAEGIDDPVEILQLCSELLDYLGDEEKASEYKQKAILTLKQQSLEIDDPAVREFYISSYRSN